MVTAAIATMTNPTNKETIHIDDDDDEASIDEEQLEEYREMVEQLGHFPVSVECVLWIRVCSFWRHITSHMSSHNAFARSFYSFIFCARY
jgi:hypothetical protein